MTKSITPIELNIHLKVKKQKITTTSQEVAEIFGKRHDHVLRAIENLECDKEFRLLNFGESLRTTKTGQGAKRKFKTYNVTKNGFVFLVMGFTGAKAAQFKVAYINAFDAMEERLQLRLASKEQKVPLSYIEESYISTVDLALIFDKDIANLNKQADIIKEDCKFYEHLHVVVKTYNHNPPRRLLNKEAFLLMNFGGSQVVANQKLRILSAINYSNGVNNSEYYRNKAQVVNGLHSMDEKLKKIVEQLNELSQLRLKESQNLKTALFSIKSVLSKASLETRKENDDAIYLLNQLTESDIYNIYFNMKMKDINNITNETIKKSRHLTINELFTSKDMQKYLH